MIDGHAVFTAQTRVRRETVGAAATKHGPEEWLVVRVLCERPRIRPTLDLHEFRSTRPVRSAKRSFNERSTASDLLTFCF